MKKILRASLDRIEENTAVFIAESGETLSFSVALLPIAKESGIYELTLDGDILVSSEYLSDETEARLARSQTRLRRLFKNK